MRCALLAFGFSLFAVSSFAQTTGFPPFGSFDASHFDAVNRQNLNANFSVPIISTHGRVTPFNLSLVYDTLIWQNSGTAWTPVTDRAGNPIWGWKTTTPLGETTYNHVTFSVLHKCSIDYYDYKTTERYNSYVYRDPAGTNSHLFPTVYWTQVTDNCTSSVTTTSQLTGYAGDGSGYYINASSLESPNVWTKSGILLNTNSEDTNGNLVSKVVVSSTETDWKDTTGLIAARVIQNGSNTEYHYYDTSGTDRYFTLKRQLYSIKTAFGCSGVADYNSSGTLPQINLPYELDLPDNSKYTFAYEPTPNSSGFYTGRLQQVTVPTGGTIQYTYPATPNNGINCGDGTVVNLTRMLSDGINSAAWNYVRNLSALTTTVTTPKLSDTPSANDTVYTFNSNGQESSLKIYSNSPGSGTPLRIINTTWAANGTPATQVTILEDGATQSEVDTTFDSNGILDSVSEYDWGSGTRGNLLRTTTLTYQTSSNYTSRNMLELLSSKVINDGTGIQYRQDITYDGVALANCPTGALQHDDTGFPCSFNYRGNPTAVTTYLTPATPANGITKNFTYDWFGNLITAQLNCCQNKTWAYSSATQYSQPDSVTSGTSPTQLTTSATYNAYTRQVSTSTDENNLVTNFSYDLMCRPTRIWQTIGSTNGASTSYSYDDVHFKMTTTTSIDATKSVQQITAVDGLGRPNLSTTQDASNNTYSIVSAQYDLLGRPYKTSNPYTASPSYWTTTAFDVLGRPTSVTLPDNSQTTYSYATKTVTVADPTGKQRESQSDGAGRLAILFEPDPSNGNQLTLQTSSTYNVLDKLTQVTQGVQTRTYVYDALGRLNSAATPEAGRVCFGTLSGSTCQSNGYDSFDNLLYRTDARGVVTNYGYDGLNRLASISYNVGTTGVPATSSATLTYGTSATQFNNGRPITLTDGVGSETYTYNNLGQMTQLQKVISGTTYTTAYAYNLASELTQITYPSGRAVQQNIDRVGRLSSVVGTMNNVNTTYASGFTYNPASQLTGLQYGNSLFASFGFAPDRLQLNCLDYSTTNRNGTCAHDSTTKFGVTYSYGAAGSNNGQIASITDSVDSGRSATYTYDALYRLTRTVTTGSTNYPAWGLSETYDRYANRSSQSIYSGCVAPMSCPTNSITIDATTNRISGSPYAYDANGNMTNDGLNTLTYDGENRAVSATNGSPSGAYLYDGNGLRVKKCLPNCTSPTTSTVYVFSGSKVIAEYSTGGPPPALVQSRSLDCGTVSSCNLSFSSNNAAGNLVVLALRVGAASPTVSVSDSFSNIYNLAASQVQTTDGHTVYIYYAMGIAAGANTIAVSLGSAFTIRMAIHEYSGVAPSAALDVTLGAQGSSTTPSSGNVTTTQASELVFGVGSSANPDTWTGGSGFTLRQTAGNKLATEDKVLSSTQTLAAAFSLSGTDNWAALIATFKAASAGGLSLAREYVYSGDALLANIDSSGTKYYHQDHLSNRLITDSSGNTIAQLGHFAFGESWYNGSNDKLIFTTYERDPESGNDYAMARYHVNRLGRFNSPDQLAGSAGNPQSWNRYAYVLNNPLRFTDPLGLDHCDFLNASGTISSGNQTTPEQCSNNGGTWIVGNATSHQPDSWGGVFTSLLFPNGMVCGVNGRIEPRQFGQPQCTGGDQAGDWQKPTRDRDRSDRVGIDLWHSSAQCPNCGSYFTNGTRFVNAATLFTVAGVATVVTAPAAPLINARVVAALGAADAVMLRTLGALSAASPAAARVLVDLGVGFQIGNQTLPGLKPQGPAQWVGFGLGAAWWLLSDE